MDSRDELAQREADLDDRIQSSNEAAEGRLRDLEEDLETRLAAMEIRLGQRARGGIAPDAREHGFRREESAHGLADGELVFPPGFVPDRGEVGELRQLVFRSSHVRRNSAYEDAASSTRFAYVEADPEFNAFACLDPVGPQIVLLGGLMREFAAMSIMVTFQPGGTAQGLREYARQRLAISPDHPLNMQPFAEHYSDAEMQQLRDARSLLCAMIMFVIAHELGHVCYGHVFGPGYAGQPIEVCRNQERDADSFASNVISSSTSREHWFAGQFFALLTMAIFEAHGVVAEFATHPTARERLRNAVRSNPEAAAALGIAEDMVDELVPAPGSLVEN